MVCSIGFAQPTLLISLPQTLEDSRQVLAEQFHELSFIFVRESANKIRYDLDMDWEGVYVQDLKSRFSVCVIVLHRSSL